MSSKKLAYLLTVLMVCGFVATGTAQGQTFSTLLISGKVTNPDGTDAAGLEVKAETVPAVPVLKPWTATSRDDGTFTVASERGAAQISAGDMIRLTVTNADGDTVGQMNLTIVEDANTTFAGNTVIINDINIQLRDSGIDIELDPAAPYADGGATSTITVTVLDGGIGVTGDMIEITANKGAVGDVTEVGGGVYTATYTTPLLDLVIPDVLSITARSTTTGLEQTLQTVLLPVPVTVKVDVAPDMFQADTPSTGAVTVTVKKATPVTDENVEITLSPQVGSVSAVTNNNDGTYTATYTSGGTAGEITLTATATRSNRSDAKTLVINAGPPAAIALRASPMTVSSLGSSTVTAMVTDAGGNPVGGLDLNGTAASGTIGTFASTAFGTYTATYTAPLVEMGDERPETITVSTDGVSANLTLDLTSEPPIDVSLISIEGAVYKVDGEVPADGVTVTVTVGSNPPDMDTTSTDGSYSAAFVGIGTAAATTGDIVSVAVANANVVDLAVNGIVHSGSQFPLGNDILERVQAGESVTINVTTDIVIPPRSVSLLTVQGTVFKETSTVPAGGGLTVTVTVGSNPPKTDTTEANGTYSVAFLGLGTNVATTGDPISVEVRDGSGVRSKPLPPKEATLSNLDLDTYLTREATVTRNVDTDIKLTSNLLVVEGTVYLKNGDTPVAAMSNLRESDLTVVVTNNTRNLTQRVSVKDNGTYGAVFQALGGAAVAETGDELTIAVLNEAGETVGSEPHTLIGAEVQAARVEEDIHTTARAVVNTLYVIGDVEDLNGSPAAGVQVTISVLMDGAVTTRRIVPATDAAGSYEEYFLKLGTPLAATGDALLVEALRESDQFLDSRRIMLSSHQLLNQPVVVETLQLRPPRLKLGGLSINPHYTGIQDPIVQKLLGMDLGTLAAAGAKVVGIPAEDLLVMLPPSLPLLLSPILAAIGVDQLELPDGFDPGNEHIDQESFGNAITTRPTAWITSDKRHSGRWFNGDQLQLYISGAPTIERVEFKLNGSSMLADPVLPGSTFPYTFQLEEELIALFEGAAFDAVQLMIDGHPQSPFDMTRNAMGVWSADVPLSPGVDVSYYYMITLSKPYTDPMGGLAIPKFAFIDPRNRQIRTDGLSQAIEGLLESELAALDPGVRSVFSVPEVNQQQSLWVHKLDFAPAADNVYQLDVNVRYLGGHTDSIDPQMIYVDRMAPTAKVALNLAHPGMNAGMYMRPDGTYVATALMQEDLMQEEASLTVSLEDATSNELDGFPAYLFQLAMLNPAGNPGTWNPVVTADLLPLNLDKLINDPASVLPLTGGGPIDMLIRNSEGGRLIGTYGLRAVGIDSLLNMDSYRGPDLALELVPPEPDIALVTSIQSDFDGNGAIEGLEMQYTSGKNALIFSNSLSHLTVYVRKRTTHPLDSIAVEVQVGADWHQLAEFKGDQPMGTELTVPWEIGDYPLPDRGGHVMLRTVTTNALGVVHKEFASLAYERRTPPEVSAIHTYVTDRHPGSGAVQGMITVGAFTQAMTSPNADRVRLEIRRSADADWMSLGEVQLAGTTVISIDDEVAIIGDRISAIVGGAPTAAISPLYRKWSLPVDTATLEDTIMDDSPAADENPYVVRAIAVDTAGTGYPSADGVTDSFSVDNYSPTSIAQVANEVEMVAPREDGSYYVSGLIADGVPDPMLTLTAWTGAHPNAFMGGLKLAVNDASGEAVEIDETVFSASGNYNYTGAFNLGSLQNGMYTFMAVAHTADGATEERIDAMAITVEVGNFTPPDNFADPTVDILSVTNTRGGAHSPSEIDAQYTTGFPAKGDKVCVTLIVPNVSAGDVDVLIGDDLMSAMMMGALTVMDPDANNNISVCLDTSGLDEDMYSLVGMVNKPNGSAGFGLPSIRVDRTAPVIKIVSPLEGHQVGSLPTVQVTYSDDTGFDPEKTNPRAVTVTFTRLGSHKEVATNPEMIRSVSAAGEVLTQSGSIVYTHDEPLAGSAYRVDVSVTDELGNKADAEPVEFTSEGVAASVSIITPAIGQVVDPDQPLIISAAFTGSGEITVEQFLINGGTTKPQSVKGNLLTHTIQPPFGVLFKRGSGNRVTVKIVDEEGNTAEATSNFAIAKDVTPPVVATYSPLGIIRNDRPIAAATVTDESGINTRSLTIIIAGVPGNQGTGRRSSKTSTTVTFTPSISVTPGPYTARVTVEDVHGNRTEAEWQFTVELDVTPPSITTSSPHGVIRSDKPIISVSASDDMSGVDTIDISVKGERWPVIGVTTVRSDKTSATFTPTGALASGTYTVNVKLADMSGNKASGQWQFTVELDTIPPSIILTRPTQEHTENRRPTISASYTDDMSGIEVGSIKFSLDGAEIKPNSRSSTQVMFTPTRDLNFGQHTVNLQVSDKAGNTTDEEWVFYVERIGIADARNYPNPFDHETTIAFRLSRQASVTIRIYDFTGRLVAMPLSNSVREAGPVEVRWHGETSAGDHLARGIYFCHILMESELEPQSAILKMAIVAD